MPKHPGKWQPYCKSAGSPGSWCKWSGAIRPRTQASGITDLRIPCKTVALSLASLDVAEAPPLRPNPLDQDGLLGLVSADITGADFTLYPATQADMRGGTYETKPSLEVIYDEV